MTMPKNPLSVGIAAATQKLRIAELTPAQHAFRVVGILLTACAAYWVAGFIAEQFGTNFSRSGAAWVSALFGIFFVESIITYAKKA